MTTTCGWSDRTGGSPFTQERYATDRTPRIPQRLDRFSTDVLQPEVISVFWKVIFALIPPPDRRASQWLERNMDILQASGPTKKECLILGENHDTFHEELDLIHFFNCMPDSNV